MESKEKVLKGIIFLVLAFFCSGLLGGAEQYGYNHAMVLFSFVFLSMFAYFLSGLLAKALISVFIFSSYFSDFLEEILIVIAEKISNDGSGNNLNDLVNMK